MNICRLAGHNIRLYRQKKGLTQEALAVKAKMNRPYLSDMEQGTKNPSLDMLDRIAKALDITVIELLQKK